MAKKKTAHNGTPKCPCNRCVSKRAKVSKVRELIALSKINDQGAKDV